MLDLRGASGRLFLYTGVMERGEFEKFVEEGLERLPQWVREKIKNVALLVEDEPSQEDRESEEALCEVG